MKKALIAFGMLLMTAGAANAGGLVTKHASSVQLTVDAARSTATQELVRPSAFQVQILILRTGQLQTQFLLVLSHLVYILQEQLQQLKIPLEQHLVSVNLIHKVMQFQLVLLL